MFARNCFLLSFRFYGTFPIPILIFNFRYTPQYREKIRQILKEGRKARQSNAEAQASPHGGASVNDNADDICWFCHVDVTQLENNKCAGCRKVTLLSSLQILRHNLLFQARYCGERCQRADWGRHGDYCVKVQEKIRKKIEARKSEKVCD